MNFYHGKDFAKLTLPEFFSALESMSYVREEQRPKTIEEITAMLGKMRREIQEANRKAKREREGRGG